MVVRWIFTDPVTSSTYTVPVNPKGGGTPSVKKSIKYAATSGPSGDVLTFEGRNAVQEMQISGVILDSAHLDALKLWYDREYQVSVTDDLGRTFSIYITSFDAKRIRIASNAWKHEYTMSYTILNWV